MAICSMPECQTSAGCRCSEKAYGRGLNDSKWLVSELQRKLHAAEEALKKIAAYDDAAASAYLRATGSYASFDEPGSVEIARTALEGGS